MGIGSRRVGRSLPKSTGVCRAADSHGESKLDDWGWVSACTRLREKGCSQKVDGKASDVSARLDRSLDWASVAFACRTLLLGFDMVRAHLCLFVIGTDYCQRTTCQHSQPGSMWPPPGLEDWLTPVVKLSAQRIATKAWMLLLAPSVVLSGEHQREVETG